MKRLLVIEDGDEYAEFARVFLATDFEVRAAASSDEALAELARGSIDAMLVDLRFDRSPPDQLTGDLAATAERLFAGDRARALRYLQDQQGALILAAVRGAGHQQPAVFVYEFPPRRLANLRALYGRVDAVPRFDRVELRRALLGAAP